MYREGHYYLIDWLRDACMIGGDDYTVLNAVYWSNDQVAKILERNVRPVKMVQASPLVTVENSESKYYEYRLPYKFFESYESGTPYFRLVDSTGTAYGTADYTLDPISGIIYFTNDTGGSAVYADLYLYNLSQAASMIWRLKAAHISEHSFDVKLGDHNLSRSQRVALYLSMAEYYARESGFNSVPMVRTDIVGS